MHTAPFWEEVLAAVGIMTLITGVIAYFLANGKKQYAEDTIKLQQENITALDTTVQRLRDDQAQTNVEVEKLKSEVKVLRDVPLQHISESLTLLTDALQRFEKRQEKMDDAIQRHFTFEEEQGRRKK